MPIARITPMLPVADIAKSVDFYAKLGFVVERQNDEWGWAKIRSGECELMLDRSTNPHFVAPRPTVIYLYPDDVVTHHDAARKNGLDVPDLDVTFYGMTEYRIDDPDGNHLWIGQEKG